MSTKRALYLGVAAIALALASPASLCAQPAPSAAVAIDADDIGGVVTGASGPEAGVWVIAETTDLPTRFTKSVVTDDQGRYVIPDLPVANYQVWVRGYGLVDSPKMRAKPGQTLNHTAVKAPDERSAAHYYPAIYWYTMMKIPPAKDFGGHTDIPKNITRDIWLQRMNNVDCVGCHQLGQEATRTIPAQFGKFDSGADAWIRRISAGQSGEMMTNRLAGQLGGVPYKYFGDWTDRVAKGELPKHKPQRPSGVERNIVVTTWDWSTPDKYLHDLISSDRRKPTVNAGGLLYGAPEYSTDNMPILDPKTHKVSFFKMPVADPNMPVSLGPGHAGAIKPTTPSAYWGDDGAVGHQGEPAQRHVRRQGPRLARRDGARHGQSGLVQEGLGSSVGQGVPDRPLAASGRRCSIPRRRSTRSSTPASARIIRSSATTPTTRCGCPAAARSPGWVNTKVWDETGDAQKAVGWFPFVLDSNGNGKLDEFAEPGKPEEGKDTRFNPGSGPYAVMPHPTDGSVWYTSGMFAGTAGLPALRSEDQAQRVLRAAEGSGRRARRRHRRGRRAVGLGLGRPPDRVRPAQVQGAAQRAERDRQSLPGRLHAAQVSGPGLRRRRRTRSAEASYYTWVDHHNAVGLGDNVPISTANLQDGFVGLQGRQDDPDARAVPDGLLRQGSRRAHRRSERRLEGPRPVERERRPHAVAQRARQGRAPDGGAHPGAAGSAGEVGGSQETLNECLRWGCARAQPRRISDEFGDDRRAT